jgi:hypothetical protein
MPMTIAIPARQEMVARIYDNPTTPRRSPQSGKNIINADPKISME